MCTPLVDIIDEKPVQEKAEIYSRINFISNGF